jgi:hypothetical protein
MNSAFEGEDNGEGIHRAFSIRRLSRLFAKVTNTGDHWA